MHDCDTECVTLPSTSQSLTSDFGFVLAHNIYNPQASKSEVLSAEEVPEASVVLTYDGWYLSSRFFFACDLWIVNTTCQSVKMTFFWLLQF